MSVCIRNIGVKCNRVSNPTIVEVPMLVYKDFGIKHCADYHAVSIATGEFEGYHLVSFDTLRKCYEFIKQVYVEDQEFIKKLNGMSFYEANEYAGKVLRGTVIEMNGNLDRRVITRVTN